MIAIMISDKPKWCAKMMNGDKLIEVRKNKALASAIKKLIDEYGYADIYVNCTKDKKDFLVNADLIRPPFPHPRTYMLGHKDYSLNGKVVFKFRCYKMEEIYNIGEVTFLARTENLKEEEMLKKSCLAYHELANYLDYGNKTGYAIHISQLEIFDRPKELWEFCVRKGNIVYTDIFTDKTTVEPNYIPLTKAPQNFCYVEVAE